MSSKHSFQSNGWLAAACIGLLGISLLVGCGRKLPPIQPGAFPPPVVVDLTHEVRGSEIFLFWSIPPVNPTKERAAAGFKVLRARQTAAEDECQACPVPYRVIADIAASGRPPGSRMKFRDALEPGFKYSYKLQSYTADEVLGKDSVSVAVTY
jgi:hypothetical protein